MSTPIDTMLAAVDWQATGQKPGTEGLPYATHSGVLEVMGFSFRCYRLSDGQAVFNAEDVERWLDEGFA